MFTAQDNTLLTEVDVTRLGVTRRLQALTAIGYSPTDLAELLNLDHGHFAGYEFDVPAYKYGSVARLFSRLHMRPGANDAARAHAKAHRWAPPLAWDEDTIDDLDAAPQGVPPDSYRSLYRIPADFADTVADYRKLGHYDEDIAKAMGMSVSGFCKRLNRVGVPEHRRGVGDSHLRPPAYAGRYRLALAPHPDRSNNLAGVARRAI